MRAGHHLLAPAGVAMAMIAMLAAESPPAWHVSFHNRLLLNRAAVLNLHRIEVMLLTASGGGSTVRRRVARIGGAVERSDDAIGYLRVEIPIDALLPLTN